MKFAIAVLVLFLAACTSTPKKETTYTPPATHEEPVSSTPKIDYYALQAYLNMDRPPEELGITEKAFNTCDAGFGYSRSQNCRQEYFVLLNFRLLCRDTEGTISTVLTDSDVTPLAGRNVKWNLKGIEGTTQTDGLGYGQIRITSPISQKKQRVRIAVGDQFLYMRANEITKVITPLPWCSQY
ncbi:hypothetical protein [Bdellovibrio sp. HCB2-146]|uniref:hypothetical protein n=1 Tax=Bdellovibrio sp. HCB2-146 TaxID=3394362 RepID=UPI0039BD54E8